MPILFVMQGADAYFKIFRGLQCDETQILALKTLVKIMYAKRHLQEQDLVLLFNNNGLRLEKTCFRGFTNNTGADQPAHPRSLISAFVILILESTICKLAAGEISIH